MAPRSRAMTRAVHTLVLAAVAVLCASSLTQVAGGEVASRRHVHMHVLVLSAADEGDVQTLAIGNCLRAMGQPYTVVNVRTAFPSATDSLNLVRGAVNDGAGGTDGAVGVAARQPWVAPAYPCVHVRSPAVW